MQEQLITALGPDDPDDGDEGRRQRGIAIAVLHEHNIMPGRHGYTVPSQSGHGAYVVNVEPGLLYCDCADFQERQQPCKHVYAVLAVRRRDERLSAEPPKPEQPVAGRMSSRQWRQYNTAQVNEGDLFARLLRDLCDTVEQPPQTIGRPRMLLADMLYGMGLKVYSTLSTRRAMSVMGAAVAAGRMDREPSYSVTIKYFERPDVTPILRELIQRSALPLRDLEVDFAQDSSGFASTAYNRWFDHKWGKASGSKKQVKWAKLHIMCGVQTNIVTVADATPAQSADSPYMPDFVRATAENFHIREVSGDMAYSSRANLHAVADAGGTAYIPFKTGAVAVQKRKGRPDPRRRDALWEQMYHLFSLNLAEFNRHYHKRSNVETCFHMMKAKFGDKVRAKTDTAMVNEVLMKTLCHNVCVLIRAMYTLRITPVFDDSPDEAAGVASAA